MPKPLLYILILSVLLRVGVACVFGDAITETRGGASDQISYDALAQRVAGGYGFSFATDWWPGVAANQPTAFWSYLYTLFLAAVYAVFGHHPLTARLIQAVLAGVLMPWLTYRLARRVFSSPSPRQERACPEPVEGGSGGEVGSPSPGQGRVRPAQRESGPGGEVAFIAAAISAIYLYFISYAASLMTETFYIIGILWTLDAAMRLAEALDNQTPPSGRLRLAIELGLAMGVTLLLRQVIVAFLAVLALWFLWLAWRRGWLRQAIPVLSTSALTLALLISPFVVRNYRLFGVIAMPNTNVGINFYWANHPIYGTRFEAVLSPEHGVSYQELIPPELRGLNDAQLDRALLARGIQIVLDDPVRYLLLCLSRIPIYFQFWPTPHSTLLSNAARLLSFGLFLPFMIYGIWLALGERKKEGRGKREKGLPSSFFPLSSSFFLLLILFLLVYTAVHLASWANVRYRLPVDAVLLIFAAVGIEDLRSRLFTHPPARAADDKPRDPSDRHRLTGHRPLPADESRPER